MNTHEKIKDMLAGFALGELSTEHTALVESHISECQECSKEVKKFAAILECTGQMQKVAVQQAAKETSKESLFAAIGNETINADTETKQVSASIWRIIMKNRITKFAAAAVIIIAILIGINQFGGSIDGSSRAYAMTDVPELLRSSGTLHIQALQWIYQNHHNKSEFSEATVVPVEKWVDIQNMRERYTSFMSWGRPNGESGIDKVEGFRDREYAMDIQHSDKTVRFNKISLIRQKLEMRRIIDYYLNEISQKQLDLFVNVGQETIDGTVFDIWEGEENGINGNKSKKIRCWLSPDTGELGRIYYWKKSNTGQGNWLPTYFIEKIERDITIPESIFEFNAPQDYTYQNTKETAFEGGLGSGWYFMGDARVSLAINFTLDDGSVIVAWHSDDLQYNRYQEQEHLFKNIAPGEKLPKLPMVIYGLEKKSMKSLSQPGINYVGRHLTYTKKKDWYYEWALYVPKKHILPTNEISHYRMLCSFNLVNNQEQEVGNLIPEHKIERNEFETLVLGAMAELSDDEIVTEDITYDDVLKLAQQIRESLDE